MEDSADEMLPHDQGHLPPDYALNGPVLPQVNILDVFHMAITPVDDDASQRMSHQPTAGALSRRKMAVSRAVLWHDRGESKLKVRHRG